jgi:hypothetical protein
MIKRRSSSDNPKRRKKFKRLLISDFHIETNYKMKLISQWIGSKINLILGRRSEKQIFAKTSTRKHITVEAKSNDKKKKFKRQSKTKKEVQKIINK